MENCTKLARLFFWYQANRGNLEVWEGGGGGLSNGPAVLPSSTSLARFECMVSGFLLVLCKFRDSLEVRGPIYPIFAPSRSSMQSF